MLCRGMHFNMYCVTIVSMLYSMNSSIPLPWIHSESHVSFLHAVPHHCFARHSPPWLLTQYLTLLDLCRREQFHSSTNGDDTSGTRSVGATVSRSTRIESFRLLYQELSKKEYGIGFKSQCVHHQCTIE